MRGRDERPCIFQDWYELDKEQIDYHVSRILAGMFVMYVPHLGYLSIKNPTARLKLIGDKIHRENQDGWTPEELSGFLSLKRLWGQIEERSLSSLYDDLGKLKLDLWYAPDQADKDYVREKIKKTNLAISVLLEKKHSHDYLSRNYIGHNAKIKYILSRSVYDEDDRRIDIDSDETYINIDDILFEFLQNKCGEIQIRDIALSEQWKSIYDRAKTNNRGIFQECAADLSDEQASLLSWSIFFENVREHPEFPGEETLKDNDLFEGWCLYQKQKREGEKDMRDISGRIPESVQGHSEIFLVRQHELNSDTPIDEDKNKFIKTVDNFNDPLAKAAKEARKKAIREKGSVSIMDLPDIRRDISMQLANMQ